VGGAKRWTRPDGTSNNPGSVAGGVEGRERGSGRCRRPAAPGPPTPGRGSEERAPAEPFGGAPA
jgi:hypothetical protein